MDQSVLFVDDDVELITFLQECTSRWPYQTYFAFSAAEAMQITEQHDIHVAVADQKMPGKSGLEFLQEIKTSSPDTVRVMMTGYAELQAVVDAINRGSVFRFIKKPFDPKHLREVVDSASEEYRRKKGRDLLLQRLEKLQKRANRTPEFESANVAFFTLTSIDGTLLDFNNVTEKLFQQTQKPLTGKSLQELLPRIDIAQFSQQISLGIQQCGVGRSRVPITVNNESRLHDVFVFRSDPDKSSEVSVILAPNAFLSQSEINLYNYVRDLEDSAQIKDKGLQFLYEMSVKVGATNSFDELVQTIFSDLREIIQFDIGMLATVEDQDVMVYVRSADALNKDLVDQLQREIHTQIYEKTGKPVHQKKMQVQIRDWSGKKFTAESHQISAPLTDTLTLPLHSPENDFIGIIFIGSVNQMNFSGEEIRLFATFVARVALVLHIINNILLFKQVREMAIKDSLTGLYNRRYFEEQIGKEIERAKRYESHLSFLMLDIDHFKRVNDKYGHLNGDIVLEDLARIIEKSTRNIDITIRYGGEEFVILLPETPLDGALVIAERLRKQVDESTFTVFEKPGENPIEIPVTVSIGLTSYSETNPVTVEDLVAQADQALYHAKSHGRNQVATFDTVLQKVL